MLDQAGSYLITASSNGLTPVSTTTLLTVNPLPATQLVVTTQAASSFAAGTAFGVVVKAEDIFGNVDPTYTGNVVLALSNNSTGAVLQGTTSENAVQGVAAFPDLLLTTASAAGGYTLQATSGALTAATSSAFTVTRGRPPSSW